jgi:hypothetical protein
MVTEYMAHTLNNLAVSGDKMQQLDLIRTPLSWVVLLVVITVYVFNKFQTWKASKVCISIPPCAKQTFLIAS